MASYTRCPHPKIQGEPQSLATLCWFACYVMLHRWKGVEEKKIKQHIIDRLTDAGIDLKDAGHTGLSLKDNKKAGMALGLHVHGYGQPVTLHNLRGLVQQSPVWATGQWMPKNNHVYVIVGVSEDWCEYYDPWWVGSPDDAYTLKKAKTEWILQGNGSDMKGLAHTFQWFPLQHWKR